MTMTRLKLKLITLCLPLFLIIGCTHTQTTDQEKARLHLKIGTAHLTKKNYPAALSELLNAEKLDPNNPIIQNNLGLAYFVRKRYALAEKHIRLAVELEPKYTEARNNLGRTLIELGLYNKALEQLKIAEQDLTYSQPDKTLSNLGIAYFKLNMFKKSLDHLKSSLNLRNKHCLTWSYYGRSFYELGQYDRATQALETAIPLCQKLNFSDPHFYSALSFFKLKNREMAKTRLTEVIEKYPDGKYIDRARRFLKIINH